MDETSLIALFERAVASRPPTPQLVAESLRLGQRLRLRRRLAAAAAAALVVGLIAVVVPIAAGARSRPAPAARPSAAFPETVYSASSDGLVTPIGVAADAAHPGIQVARMINVGDPLAVAPGGHVIYAASAFGEITPIYPSTGKAGRPIRVAPHGLGTILITPDGRTAYVTEPGVGVIPVDLPGGLAGQPIRTVQADQIVMTPDGRTLYAFGNSRYVLPIRTASNMALKSILVGEPADTPIDIAVSPDSATVYVLTGSPSRFSGEITPVSTATNAPQQPIKVPGSVMDMSISPTGRMAYVTDYTRQHRYVVLPVDLAARKVLRPISLPAPFWDVTGVVFSPDGSMAYLAIGARGANIGTEVVPIRTATNTELKPVRLPFTQPVLIAVSPDSSTVYVSGQLGPSWTKFAVYPIRAGAATAGRPVAVPEAPVALVFVP
jgi:hypothetical protein